MALSTSTAKIQFNVGSFDATTSLDIPSSAWEDKITFSFPELVSPQLTDSPTFDPAGGAGNVFGIVRVLFNGEEVYENAQWDSIPTFPSSPDFTVAVTGFPSDPVETYTINNLDIGIIKNSSGEVANGTYTVSIRWFYQYDGGGEWATFLINYPVINFVFESKSADIDFGYNTDIPEMDVTDLSEYVIQGTSANAQREFNLFPPKNKQKVTTLTTNQRTVRYTTFYTGGNEMKLFVLLTYDFGLYETINLVSSYKAWTVYLIDRCSLYECLRDVYAKWSTKNCAPKIAQERQQSLIAANSLALQLLTARSCSGVELSKVLDEFNALTGCGCSCLDSTPRLIQKALIAETSQVQLITATTATTAIDLDEGNKIYITLLADTEIVVDSIGEHEKYTFIITGSDYFTATFSSDFVWPNGYEMIAAPSADNEFLAVYYFEETDGVLANMIPQGIPEPPNDGEKNFLREEDGAVFWEPLGTGAFLSAGDNVSLLTNDAGYTTQGEVFERAIFNDIGSTFSYSVGSTNANVIEISTSSATLAISVFNRTNIVLGRPYVFVVKNSGVSTLTLFFAGGDFTDSFTSGLIASSIPAGKARSFMFVGAQPDGFATKTMIAVSRDENYVKVGDSNALLQNDSNYLGAGANISLLNNNLGYITEPFSYSDIGTASGATEIDFGNDGEYQKFDATADISFSATGLLEGKKYGVIVRNTSMTESVKVSFTSPSFVGIPDLILPRGTTSFVSLEFVSVFISSSVRLVNSSRQALPIFSSQSVDPQDQSGNFSIDVSVAASGVFNLTTTSTEHDVSIANPYPFGEYTIMLINDSGVSKNISFVTPNVYDSAGPAPTYSLLSGGKMIVMVQSLADDGEAIIKSVTP